MSKTFLIDPDNFSLSDFNKIIAEPNSRIEFSQQVYSRVAQNRAVFDSFLKDGRTMYGVNTGMGGFVGWLIPEQKLGELQTNLLNGVATNVGTYLSDTETRAAILARVISLAQGNSAITEENFKKLIALFNAGVLPCIPEKGSLGTSGDLGPLACIALVATGQWKATYNGQALPGAEALSQASLTPMVLGAKEGLALVNGTSAMVGMAAVLIAEVESLLSLYDAISALTLETLKAKRKPFDPRVHALKPHPGQLLTAQNIFHILADSKMIIDEDKVGEVLQEKRSDKLESDPSHIEDAYSLRCTPQILGPIRDNVQTIRQVIEHELNSSNDNPLVITSEHDLFHSGNFHGQYLAMAMDQLVISLTTLSNLSDRRIDRFLDEHHSNGLPPFLSTDPGLKFGLMGGQFMSTSLTAENRSLCVPVSVQTLPSTGDFQDIVSLGLVAARRAKTVLENTKYIIAFELMCGCQAADIRGVANLSSTTAALYAEVREIVPFYKEDQFMTEHLEALKAKIPTLAIPLQ